MVVFWQMEDDELPEHPMHEQIKHVLHRLKRKFRHIVKSLYEHGKEHLKEKLHKIAEHFGRKINRIYKKLQPFIQEFYLEHQDAILALRDMVVDMKEDSAEAAMAYYLTASHMIYVEHEKLCEDAPASFEDHHAWWQFFHEEPIEAVLCSEKATLAVNYLAFLVSQPAYYTQRHFQQLLWFLGIEDAEERAQEMGAAAREDAKLMEEVLEDAFI